jgi:hypothetical protein
MVDISLYRDWIIDNIPDYDTDMDGLPDWWELEYGVDETSMAAADDLDGDGFTNYEEWVADTVPTDGGSYLRILEYPSPTNLVFNSSTNRAYQVQYRTDLAETNELWQTEVDLLPDPGTQTVASVSTASSNRFYRIRARLR